MLKSETSGCVSDVPWGHFLILSTGERIDAPFTDLEGYHVCNQFNLEEFQRKSKLNLFWSLDDNETPITVLKREGKIVSIDLEKKRRKIALHPLTTGYYLATLINFAESKSALESAFDNKRIRIPSERFLENCMMATRKSNRMVKGPGRGKPGKGSGKPKKKESKEQILLKLAAKKHNTDNVLKIGQAHDESLMTVSSEKPDNTNSQAGEQQSTSMKKCDDTCVKDKPFPNSELQLSLVKETDEEPPVKKTKLLNLSDSLSMVPETALASRAKVSDFENDMVSSALLPSNESETSTGSDSSPSLSETLENYGSPSSDVHMAVHSEILAQLKSVQSKYSSLQSTHLQCSDLKKNHETLQRKYDKLKSWTRQVESERDKLRAMQTEFDKLTVKYKTLKDNKQADSVNSKYSTLKADFDKLKAKYNALKGEKKLAEDQLASFKKNYPVNLVPEVAVEPTNTANKIGREEETSYGNSGQAPVKITTKKQDGLKPAVPQPKSSVIFKPFSTSLQSSKERESKLKSSVEVTAPCRRELHFLSPGKESADMALQNDDDFIFSDTNQDLDFAGKGYSKSSFLPSSGSQPISVSESVMMDGSPAHPNSSPVPSDGSAGEVTLKASPITPDIIRNRMKLHPFALTDNQVDILLGQYKRKRGEKSDGKYIKKGVSMLWTDKELWNRSATGASCPSKKMYEARPECTPEKKDYLADFLRLKILSEQAPGSFNSDDMNKRIRSVQKNLSEKVSYLRRKPEPAENQTESVSD